MRTSKIVLHSTTHATPVGELTLIASDWGLRAVLWPADSAKRVRISTRPRLNADHPVLARAVRQLDEYFEGSRTGFDVPLDLDGTPFQLAAWQALTMIPFGTTTTYRQQAVNLGIPSAARALGAATHANPVSIIIPCHRVIGSDGTLTGFAGGLPTKQSLLDHEARVVARGRRSQAAAAEPGANQVSRWHRLPEESAYAREAMLAPGEGLEFAERVLRRAEQTLRDG